MIFLNNPIQVIGGAYRPALQALRAFFVSPDVADYFRFTYHMKRPLLLELVNSFIRTPITESVLDAFLTICYDRGDLFTINLGGSVSYTDGGWERVDEMPVAGPSRNNRPVKPPNQDEIKQWLLQNKARFIVPDRSISLTALGVQVREAFPNMTPNILMNAIHYFSYQGRMFRM